MSNVKLQNQNLVLPHPLTTFMTCFHLSFQCVVSATTAYTIFSTVSLSDTPIIALLNAGCPSTMDSLTHIEELARLSMVRV